MSQTVPTTHASAAVRDALIVQAREALRRFARKHDFLATHLCGCGRAACLNDHPETMSFVGMLRAVATEWRGEPDPAGEAVLRERLLSFARGFGLDECPCADPECPSTVLERGDARDVLRTVADLWHGRAGNRMTLTSELIGEMAQDHARNLAVLHLLAFRIDPSQASRLHPLTDGLRRALAGGWVTEARAMAAEAIASWLPAPGSIPEVHRVLDAALSVAYHGGWSTGDAAVFEQAAADAVSAVLVRGLAHPSVTEALYAPLASLASLADLDAACDVDLIASGAMA